MLTRLSQATTGSWLLYAGWFFALLAAWRLSKRSLTRWLKKRELSQARDAVQHFKRIMRPRGMARPLTPFLLLCLTAPSVGAGFVAGYYANAARRAQSTETYTFFKVLAVYDPWNFQAQFVAGGDPFLMKFVHDGSDTKLGWDKGMIIKYAKFQRTPTGLTMAADNLGMEVLREGAKFVDWREQ